MYMKSRLCSVGFVYSGYGHESLTELAEVPGTGNTPGMVLYVPYRTQTFSITEVQSAGMEVLRNSQKFRVRVWKSYRTEVQSEGMEVLQNSQQFRVGTRTLYLYPYPHPGIFTRPYPYPGHLPTGADLTEVAGTGMNVVHNLQNFRVRVIPRVWFCTYHTEPFHL